MKKDKVRHDIFFSRSKIPSSNCNMFKTFSVRGLFSIGLNIFFNYPFSWHMPDFHTFIPAGYFCRVSTCKNNIYVFIREHFAYPSKNHCPAIWLFLCIHTSILLSGRYSVIFFKSKNGACTFPCKATGKYTSNFSIYPFIGNVIFSTLFCITISSYIP